MTAKASVLENDFLNSLSVHSLVGGCATIQNTLQQSFSTTPVFLRPQSMFVNGNVLSRLRNLTRGFCLENPFSHTFEQEIDRALDLQAGSE